jgi:predicted nuclease with TOPRIM domain
MARKRKDELEVIEDEVVDTAVEELVELEDVLDLEPEVIEDAPDAVEELAEDLASKKATIEEFKDEKVTEAPKDMIVADYKAETGVKFKVPSVTKVKKIVLNSGKTAINDLRVPVGFDKMWNEDKVVTVLVKAKSVIEIVIPEECDLNKWVSYYNQLKPLGIKVQSFGIETK